MQVLSYQGPLVNNDIACRIQRTVSTFSLYAEMVAQRLGHGDGSCPRSHLEISLGNCGKPNDSSMMVSTGRETSENQPLQ